MQSTGDFFLQNFAEPNNNDFLVHSLAVQEDIQGVQGVTPHFLPPEPHQLKKKVIPL